MLWFKRKGIVRGKVHYDALKQSNRVKVSENFSLHEFECHGGSCCNHAVKVHSDLIKGLQRLRDALKKKYPQKRIPIKLLSSFRCVKHNKKIGGVKDSEHIYGLAADVDTRSMGLPELEVAQIANSLHIFNRIGVYGKSYLTNSNDLISVKGYRSKVGFIHLGIADKVVNNIVLPGRWGDWS